MPYIKSEKRAVLDPEIDNVIDALRQLASDDPDNNHEGNLNYVITSLLVKAYGLKTYREINDVVGALECCKLEFYRRAAIPIENQKAHDNGDVYNTPNVVDLLKQQ